MKKKLTTGCALLLSVAMAFTQASAQSSARGNLAGTVTDPSNAVIQGAQVTITGPIGENTAASDGEGRFLFRVLIPGSYSLRITKEGFKTSDVKSAQVIAGNTATISVKLELGSSSTVVVVTAAGVALDTTSTAVQSNFSDNFYRAIPVGRGVVGLFYAAPAVTSGLGTGTANPSISGSTGLENNYVADGVSITDGAFGGIGIYSRIYGSLSTGINLSFVKEVNVKTGGFEAQYGKSTGGIVQIVTKTGSNRFHGSVGGFFAPRSMEAQRSFSDDFALGSTEARFNLEGKVLHQSNYDVDAEAGGYVPGMKDHLFFFGSFNPQWNTDYAQMAQFRNPADLLNGVPTQTSLGDIDVGVRVYSYAGKLTYRVNDSHQFEASVFGDPTYGDNNPNGSRLPVASPTTFDKLQFGTRNFVVRYNATLTPTWLFSASWAWGHSNLNDTPGDQNVYRILDYSQTTPCGSPNFSELCRSQSNVLRGSYTRQGVGYHEDTTAENYGLSFDTQKVFNFLGQHTLGFGYRYDVNHYDGTRGYTGPNIPFTPAEAVFVGGDPALQAKLVQNGTSAVFKLVTDPGLGLCGVSEIDIPGMSNCADGGVAIVLLQVAGEFGDRTFKSRSGYTTLFAQDQWSPNKYLTINAGLRWEQQNVAGGIAHYAFVDNWSPRIGVSVDPWGDRKTKVTANFGRYTEALPLDIAIRSLSSEFDFPPSFWLPPVDGAGHVAENADGTLNFTNFNPAGNLLLPFGGVSVSSGPGFAHGTKGQYLDEFMVGFEHEFGNSGVIFSARYTDRRIKRIFEDNAAVSPEASQAGLGQFFVISNANKAQDLFKNPVEIPYINTDPTNPMQGAPAGCVSSGTNKTLYSPGTGAPYDSNENPIALPGGQNAFCIPNAYDANDIQITATDGADGTPDGFVDPIRKYQAMVFEVEKATSNGWQMRANYRIAKLYGNYEGLYRNDNNQNDPNISSLFDFTQGIFNLLGQQFVPGVLNTDVRHLANGFVSYTFANHLNGLTVGSSVHFQTGVPINNLYAHPVYENAGEVPFCADNTTNCTSARGSLGRTRDYGQVNFHVDYPIRLSESTRLRIGTDLFNLTNSKTQLRVDQAAQQSLGIPNVDFGKPTGVGPSAVSGNTNPAYLRPFYARVSVKLEF